MTLHRSAHKPNFLPGNAGRLTGIDFSSNNFTGQSKASAANEFKKDIRGQKFTFVKATQGKDYKNPYFRSEWEILGDRVKSGKTDLRVAYHWLNPGNEADGKAQAKRFLDAAGIDRKLRPGTRLALDWEGPALRTPAVLRGAADYIHKRTGVWPIVYTSTASTAAAHRIAPHCPKWEANYGAHYRGINDKGAKILPSQSDTFVQYSNGTGYGRDYDLNAFNGSEAKLRKFAGFRPPHHHHR